VTDFSDTKLTQTVIVLSKLASPVLNECRIVKLLIRLPIASGGFQVAMEGDDPLIRPKRNTCSGVCIPYLIRIFVNLDGILIYMLP
jgi:hypothetical protein